MKSPLSPVDLITILQVYVGCFGDPANASPAAKEAFSMFVEAGMIDGCLGCFFVTPKGRAFIHLLRHTAEPRAAFLDADDQVIPETN